MQPRILALIITILPILISNIVYLLSAYEGYISWCIPYIDGCTTISKAARSGNSIFIFRATMIAYGILLIWFWIYVRHWLDQLYGHTTNIARAILWLGIVGALFFIVYIDFLGTTGEVNRFMRRWGILLYFVCTPLAQILLLRQHYHIFKSLQKDLGKLRILHFQFVLIVLMMVIGIVHGVMEVTYTKTNESENIVEWNLALLMQLYFLGIFFIWKEYKFYLKNDSDSSTDK